MLAILVAVEQRIFDIHAKEVAALRAGELGHFAEAKASLLREWEAAYAAYEAHVTEHGC